MSGELDRLRASYGPLEVPLPARSRARLDDVLAGAPRRAPRRSLVPAFAVSGLAVAAIAVAALLPGSNTRAPSVASARAACAPRGAAAGCGRALGDVVAGATIPGNGDVLYRRGTWIPVAFTISASAHRSPGTNHIQLAAAREPFIVVRKAIEEFWLAPDGHGRETHTDGGRAEPQTVADEAAWRAAGSPDLESLVPNPQGMRPLSQDVDGRDLYLGANGLYDFLPHDGDPLRPIPHQPAALADWLRERAFKERAGNDPGCHPDGTGCNPGVLRTLKDTYVGDIQTLLNYPATSADLRSALVTLLGEVPGARSLGLVHDPQGRVVAAIRVDNGDAGGGEPSVIAFDPDTGELRATGSDGPEGTIRWSTTYAIDARRVPAVGDRP